VAFVCNGGHGRSAALALCYLVERAVDDPEVLAAVLGEDRAEKVAPAEGEGWTVEAVREVGRAGNEMFSAKRNVRKAMHLQPLFVLFSEALAAEGGREGGREGRRRGRDWSGAHCTSEYFEREGGEKGE